MADTSDLQQLTAEELAIRARGGDDGCFAEIVARHRAALVAFLSRRLARPSDAEDLAQETFLRAHRNLASYDEARKFAPWLYAIGKNIAANHSTAEARRHAREQKAVQQAECLAEGSVALDGPTALMERHQQAAAQSMWRRARAMLSEDSYRALWLRYAEDQSVQEIATTLGRTKVAVKVMLFRARRTLGQEEG